MSNRRLHNHPITRADHLTRTLTAARSFEELLQPGGAYRPSLYAADGPDTIELGDLYDAEQARRGDARRAYRGCDAARLEELRREHVVRETLQRERVAS